MSAAGRIKQAVRRAIGICGGIEGAAATVEKSSTHVGRWNALNEDSYPTLPDALAIDEIAVAQGKVPAILSRLAAELGHVCLRQSPMADDCDDLHAMLAEHCRRSGELSGELSEALADRHVCSQEAGEVLDIAERQARHLARMVQALRLIADGGAS